jgi:hypothetical protein
MESGHQIFKFYNYYNTNNNALTPVFDVKDSYLKWYAGDGFTSADKDDALKKYYISQLSPSGNVDYTVEPTAFIMKLFFIHPDKMGVKGAFMTKYLIYYVNDAEGVPG